jgi:TnpA family transposase
MTSLLDVLKETDLRVGFTEVFKSLASREQIDRPTLQRRLLLCLFGLGTNTGLKRVAAGDRGVDYKDLLYVHRRFLTKAALREAIPRVVNAIFAVRRPDIWGEGTSTCASDSKKFGAWDQNLMTEWHIRYGGRGVMVYWHVERKSVCIYSQLKRCSSSEVAAMIEGVLRHCTDMEVQRNYVDSHGQSEVAFAFCHLLGFELLPRLKAIASQKLYRPQAGHAEDYSKLQPILTRPINWASIGNQYDEMIKYTTALRLGTAEP